MPNIDWEAIYRLELPRVYNFLRYRVQDDALAEDLTGATFLRAWRSREQYRADLSAFSTWLFSIARNLAADYFRRRRDEISLEVVAMQPDSLVVEEIAERSADLRQLAALLRDLNQREQELIALKYGAGLTNRAIADITGLSESNVGTILHRIVVRLREQMGVEQ